METVMTTMERRRRQAPDPEFDAILARVDADARASSHLRTLGTIHLVLSVLTLAVSAIVFVAIAPWGLLSGEPGVALLVGGIGTVIAGFIAALAIPGLALGFGLRRERAWARPLGFVLAVLMLFNVPFGTILGAYTLYVLLQEPVRERLEAGRD